MESRGVDFFLNPPTPAPRFPAQSRTSFYIESFDGTRLALDLYLPQDAAGRCPRCWWQRGKTAGTRTAIPPMHSA